MTPLYGHDAAIAAFRDGLASGRLHHAWLISGAEGIGKTLFAEKAALRILAEAAGPPLHTPGLDVPDDHPMARLVAADSHSDLVRLERLPAKVEDRSLPRREWLGQVPLARGIKVDEVREARSRLNTKPAMSATRVVIVDAADDLERAGANALLKSLEEPPQGTIFLLVSHRPRNLFPTIRSRCRQLRLSALDDDAMTSALRAALPGADEAEIDALRRIGEGSPGRALAFRGLEIEALDKALRTLAAEGDPANARRSELALSLSLKSAQPRYEAFLQRVPSLIAAAARERRGPALAEALRLWERASDLAGTATRLSLDPHSVAFELSGMVAALAPRR